jgi:hypothetical protein
MTEGRREPPSERPFESQPGPVPNGDPTPPGGPRPTTPDGCTPEAERFGPLLVERHRKADGRPLTLYWEAPGDDETAGEPEARAAGEPEASGDG